MDSGSVMLLIDNLRNEKKMTINELTQGIISRRNYSRYLSGELRISFGVLSKFLERLKISFSNFFYYNANVVLIENKEETHFHYLIFDGLFDEAYDKYYEKFKNYEFKTHLAKKALPCSLIYLEYRKKIKPCAEAAYQMQQIIKPHLLSKKHIFTDDDIEAFYIYSKVCSKEDMILIKDYLIDFFVHKKHKNYSINHERSMLVGYVTLLDIITRLYEDDDNIFKQVTSLALEFFIRGKIELFDLLIFEILYKHLLRHNLFNERIAYYYINCLLVYRDHQYLSNKTFEVRESDYNNFLKIIADDVITKEEMYEGLINYDYI